MFNTERMGERCDIAFKITAFLSHSLVISDALPLTYCLP